MKLAQALALVILQAAVSGFLFQDSILTSLEKAAYAPSSVSSVKRIPKDDRGFTQGLQFYNGLLYESTGMYGQSSIRIVHPDSGVVLTQRRIGKKYFGEGIAVFNDIVYMLTWKENDLMMFDAHSLEHLDTVTIRTHSGEGWGLTLDPTQNLLIASDGSSYLTYFRPPEPEPNMKWRRRSAKSLWPVRQHNEKHVEYISLNLMAIIPRDRLESFLCNGEDQT